MKKLCINCAHPEVIDPVTGEAASCYVARGRDGTCWAEGMLFSERLKNKCGAGQQQESKLVGLIYRREDGVEMSEAGEKCSEMWTVSLMDDGNVKLRHFTNGMVSGIYRQTSRELAMLDMVAILQGLQPLRYLRRPDKLPGQTPVARDDHPRDKRP